MTLKEIIHRVARYQGAPVDLVGGFVHEAIDEVVRALDEGHDVKIRGLGTFQWRGVTGRPGSGVRSGSEIEAGVKLKFTPAKKFRSRRKQNVRQRRHDEVRSRT